MNERLRELREQAVKFAEVTYNNYTMATFDTNKSIETLFEEKFAELIVSECAKISEEDAVGDDPACCTNTADRIARTIKQHFGVKE